jgi:hypothetical protein
MVHSSSDELAASQSNSDEINFQSSQNLKVPPQSSNFELFFQEFISTIDRSSRPKSGGEKQRREKGEN